MRVFIYLLSILLLSSCANAPTHMYGTDKLDIERLAVVEGKGNEVKILEIDDKPFTGKREQPVYLTAGVHKFLVQLNWEDMIMVANVPIITDRSSKYLRTGCLDLEAGKRYTLAASDPSPDWKFTWIKGPFNKVEIPACKGN